MRSYSSSVTWRTVAIRVPSMGVWTSSSGPEPIHSPAKPPGFTSSSPSAASKRALREEVAAEGAGVVMVEGFIVVESSLRRLPGD